MGKSQQKMGGLTKAKSRRSAKNKASGKYVRQFARTVRRTGRWRGKRFDRRTLQPIG